MNPQNYVMPHDDLLFKINLKLERWSQTVLNNFFPRFWANIYLRSIVITQCLPCKCCWLHFCESLNYRIEAEFRKSYTK